MTPAELETAERFGICGWPCHYGGVKAMQRAGGHRDLGWAWHCNRRTGGRRRCWQHAPEEVTPQPDTPPKSTAT